MNSLKEYAIDDLVEKYLDFRGRTPKKLGKEWGNGEIKALSANNISMGKIDFTKECYHGDLELYNAWMTKGDCAKGDVIMTMEAPLGNVAQIPDHDKYILSQRSILFKTKADIVFNDYFYYLLCSDLFQRELGKNATGTTAQGIQQKKLSKILVKLPNIDVQKKVSNHLRCIDIAIENSTIMIKKLRKIRTGMKQDLFARGVDEQGKLRATYKEAPELYQENELGYFPKGWNISLLGDVTRKIQDGTHYSPVTTKGPFKYITSKNIRFGYMDLTKISYISEEEHDSIYNRCDVKKGDVLLTKDGANTGNVTLNTLDEPFSMLSSVAFIRSDETKSHNRYILQYLMTPLFQRLIKDSMSGNAITRITLTIIRNLKIPFPDILEQGQISDKLEIIDESIKKEERILNKYICLKEGMMKDLLTGEVSVNI